jgi:hypothetical protein
MTGILFQFFSNDRNFVSLDTEQVVFDGEKDDEGREDGGSAQQVPQVVVVEHVEHRDAVLGPMLDRFC